MPSAQVQVYPVGTGDYFGEKVSGTGAPAASLVSGFWGWSYGVFPVASTDRGWIGRFELPIPNGAHIRAAALSFWMTGASTPGFLHRQTAGLLAPDGVWEIAGGGFSSSQYPTRDVMPWPERNGGSYQLSKWYGAAPFFSFVTFANVPSGGVAMSWGEGMVATNQVVGLVASLQSWLDTYGPTFRSGSVSGNDLPVAICWYRSFGTAADPSEGLSMASSGAVLAQRPFLTVTWDDPNPPSSILAEPDIRAAVRGSANLTTAIGSGISDVRPSPSSKWRIR